MLSKTAKYGLKAIMYMVQHKEASQKIFKVDELSKELGIPKYFLSKVLLDLTRKNLLSSMKGPNGGFYFKDKQLDHKPSEILFALEGDAFLKTCMMELKPCDMHKVCPFHGSYSHFKENLIAGLNCKTFRQFSENGHL